MVCSTIRINLLHQALSAPSYGSLTKGRSVEPLHRSDRLAWRALTCDPTGELGDVPLAKGWRSGRIIGAKTLKKKHETWNIEYINLKVLNLFRIQACWASLKWSHNLRSRRLQEWLPTLLCHDVPCVRSSVTNFHSIRPPTAGFASMFSASRAHSSKYIWRLVDGRNGNGLTNILNHNDSQSSPTVPGNPAC